MSTENGPSTTAPDPKTIAGQLRQEIRDLEQDTEALPTEQTDNERWSHTHLADLAISYSPAVEAAVDAVLRSRPITDTGRRATLAAVDRELAGRRWRRGQLPVVLRAVRQKRNLTLAALASMTGISHDQLSALETGAIAITRELQAQTLATWIRTLDPPHNIVISALRRSLQTTDQPLLAAGMADQPTTDDDFISQVLDLLGWDEEVQ